MTDYRLIEFARKAQEDARRCYGIYIIQRNVWEKHGSNPWDMGDVKVWQYRASLAAEHALKMLEIVTR